MQFKVYHQTRDGHTWYIPRPKISRVVDAYSLYVFCRNTPNRGYLSALSGAGNTCHSKLVASASTILKGTTVPWSGFEFYCLPAPNYPDGLHGFGPFGFAGFFVAFRTLTGTFLRHG